MTRAIVRALAEALSNGVYLKDHQVAEILNVSRAALKLWRQEDRGPRVTYLGDSRSLRYAPEAVAEFIAARDTKEGMAVTSPHLS